VEVGLSTPATDYLAEGSETTVSYQHSATASISYDWWNTTIRGEYNTIDLSVSTPDDQPGFEGNVTQGVYFEQKPVQVAAAFALASIIVAGVIAIPETLLPLSAKLGEWLANPITP
jgi:hypothetical protein